MRIYHISPNEVQDFIDCYIEVFETLKGILPLGYVNGQIEKAYKTDFYDRLISEFDSPDNILLAASFDDKLIGMTWGGIKDDGSAWLGFMGVKKQYRRKGTGRALLHRFIDICRDRGVHRVSLNTDEALVQAISLYESEGFVRDGLIKNQYGLELILFTKKL